MLLDIRDKTGAALVVIEHDMPLITGDLRRAASPSSSAPVVARGAPDEVINDPRVVEGYLGGTRGGHPAVGRARPRRRRPRAAAR